MTEFIVEKTGERIRVQTRWNPTGKAGEFTIYAAVRQTETGDILSHPDSGHRFLLGEHNLNGLQFRRSPHYRAGFFTITDGLNVWRNGDMIAAELPAVVSAGTVWREETPARIINGQRFRIAIQPTDIRKGDELQLDRTKNCMRVEEVVTEAWDGIFLLWGVRWT